MRRFRSIRLPFGFRLRSYRPWRWKLTNIKFFKETPPADGVALIRYRLRQDNLSRKILPPEPLDLDYEINKGNR
jgi:hypothetical protein